MRAIQIMVFLLFTGVFLGGCSGTNTTRTTTTRDIATNTEVTVVDQTPESPLGQSDFGKHVDGKARHDEAEAKRIVAQTSAIMASPTPTSGESGAYANAMKVMAVAMLKPTDYGEGAPETIVGMFKSLGAQIPLVWAVKTLGSVAETGIKNAGSSVSGGSTVTDSLNHTEANPTTVGTNNTGTASSQGTSTPTVVEQPAPVIVEPSYAPTEAAVTQ